MITEGTVELPAFPKTERKEKAMIARFDHRPMLTALLALSTIVLVVVVMTLATLLITSPPAASPPGVGSGNPGAAPANMDAGGDNYGYDIYNRKATWEAVRKEIGEIGEVNFA
jgi:hypothetical protein